MDACLPETAQRMSGSPLLLPIPRKADRIPARSAPWGRKRQEPLSLTRSKASLTALPVCWPSLCSLLVFSLSPSSGQPRPKVGNTAVAWCWEWRDCLLNTPVLPSSCSWRNEWFRAMIPECSLINFRGTCSGPVVNQPGVLGSVWKQSAVNKHRAEQLRGPRDFDFAEMQICGMGIFKC